MAESLFQPGGRREPITDDDVDMTPMIDCVFLLLIFFIATATYVLQKSIEVPAPEQRESAQARTVEELQADDDYVVVRIERDNTVWADDSEAPSEHDLLVKLRQARQSPGAGGRGPTTLLVLADGEAWHQTVVMALDAGCAVGMENIRLAMSDEESL